jgi:hypothetical protein
MELDKREPPFGNQGRRSELARAIGTTPQAVTDWFAKPKQPAAEQSLEMMDFLKTRRKRK